MKKLLLFIAVFSLETNILLAQNNPTGEDKAAIVNVGDNHFYFGIRAIPHVSWLENLDDLNNSQDKYKTEIKWGAGFGVGGGYNFNDNIGISIDVLYSMQGSRYMFRKIEYTQSLNYLNVPVLFVYTTDPAPVLFIGKVGPQVGFLTGAKVDPASPNNSEGITNNKEQFNDIVIGGVLSGGARCIISDKLFLDILLRCDISFFNAENSSYKYYSSDRADTRNITAGIEIGANYLLGK